MPIEVKVPSLGESITSGVLATWHVKDGDLVEKDQLLFELETDKITSEGNAETAGKISLSVAEGDEVEIGQVVAVIDETASGSPSKKEPAAEEKSEPAKEQPKSAKPAAGPKNDTSSPAVRRIAAETGLDPSAVDGSGKGGRVTKGDMLAAADSAKQSPAAEPVKPAPAAPKAAQPARSDERDTRRKMTPIRRSIAQRLVAAQQEAAILTTFNEVDMSAVMDLRKKHQEAFVEAHGIKLGFMSFFIKAVVQALHKVPALNARIDDEEIVQNHFYDIGVAVSTPKGLMVPVVRDCEQKSFADLEADLAAYAARARDGKIEISDLSGGVFSITNGGVFGSLLSTPIINPPQSGILGMHTIQQRPVAVNGQVVIRPMMYLALSYDHRIVDGKEAVTFLVSIKQAIEDPARLLFDL